MKTNSKVKVYLINSLTAEGIVESFNDSKLILISNKKQLVINNPNQNIIMYYVLEEDIDLKIDSKIENKISEDKKEHNKDIGQDQSNTILKFKKIADLKIMAAEAEREEIRKQLTTFHSVNTDNLLGKYGTPSFIRSKHNTSEKINDGDAADLGSMSKMSGSTIK